VTCSKPAHVRHVVHGDDEVGLASEMLAHPPK
jgi:hypothetical protein